MSCTYRRRDVPLSSRAVAALQALKDTRHGVKGDTTESRERDADRVFEIRSDAVTRAFERAVARARKLYVDEVKATKLRPDGKFLMDLRFHDRDTKQPHAWRQSFPCTS